MSNYSELVEKSENELEVLIQNAQKLLREKQDSKRKDVISEIRRLAASIGETVEFSGTVVASKPVSSRKGIKVPIKYMNPGNATQTWTGRGVKPRWLRELVQQGRDLKEFEVA
jgi:DNA-binding protein H-NS